MFGTSQVRWVVPDHRYAWRGLLELRRVHGRGGGSGSRRPEPWAAARMLPPAKAAAAVTRSAVTRGTSCLATDLVRVSMNFYSYFLAAA